MSVWRLLKPFFCFFADIPNLLTLMIKRGFYGFKKVGLFFISIVFCFSCLADPLTEGQYTAKVKGITLYNQYKDGDTYLRVAAEAGDRESQYYLAESLRLHNRYMTEEAYKWYVAAAEQGDYYAMYRLSSSSGDLCSLMSNCPIGAKTTKKWLKLGGETAEARAKQGDAEAMYVLYYLTADEEWLERAVEAGYPEAQYRLAIMYREGHKFFFRLGINQKKPKNFFANRPKEVIQKG